MRDKNNFWTKWLGWYVCLGVWVCQNAVFDFIENTFIASLVVGLITVLGAWLYSKSIDYIIAKEHSVLNALTKLLTDIFTTLMKKNKELQEIKEENERLKDQLKNNK